jgi:hypothetical protein
MTAPSYRLQGRRIGEPWITLSAHVVLEDGIAAFDAAAAQVYALGDRRFHRWQHVRLMRGAAQVLARTAYAPPDEAA